MATSVLLVEMWKTCFQIQGRAFVLVCTTFFIEQCALCAVRCAVCNVQSHCRSVQWKSVKLLPGITTVKQYVCEVVLLKPEQRLGRDHQSPVTQTARRRRLSFCPLAEARDCPTPSIPSLKSQIQIYQTRSLGARLLAGGPSGLLDFVLCTLRMLRPSDPRR